MAIDADVVPEASKMRIYASGASSPKAAGEQFAEGEAAGG